MHLPVSITFAKSIMRPFGVCALIMMISACGGGGGGGGKSPTPTTSAPSSSSVSSVESSSSSTESSTESSIENSSSVSSAAASFAALSLDSPDALAQAIYFDGGYSLKADIPAPAEPTGGTISINSEVAITANGNTQLDLAAEGLAEGMHVHAYLIQIEGAETSFVIPVGADGQPYAQATTELATSEKTGQSFLQKAMIQAANPRTQLSCNGYPNLTFTAGPAGETPYYEAPAKVYAYVQADVPPINPPVYLIPSMSRERENWTAPATIKMKAVKVGSGKIQITLTWNTEADVDLYLVEPDGHTITYFNDTSNAGDGFLDVDDTDGFGPENIFFEEDIPAGEYKVQVNLFDVSSLEDLPTSYTVKVKRNNISEVFTGSLGEVDETDDVTTFTMNASGGTGGGSGSGSTSGPGSTSPGSYPTRENTLLGSEACEGYTNENFMSYFEQNSTGPDVQLHTLCAAAFNYYSMYLNAIRMGYSESEANITYGAFEDAALVATDFYANAQ